MPAFTPWHGLLEQLQTNGALTLAALPPPFGHGPPAGTVFQLMQAVLLLLRDVASARPLVLLLDDLHWADPHSLELLDLATRGLDNLPLLIIVAYRTSDIHHQALYTYLPDLQRNRRIETIELLELSLADVTPLVESDYGQCSADLAGYLHGRSDGNPLFLVQLLRDLAEQGALRRDHEGRLLPPDRSVQVPALLQHVIAHRITSLGSDVEALLGCAAVAGQQ
jgi:predicted ATPase